MKKIILISSVFLLSFQQIDNKPNYSFDKGKLSFLTGNYKLAINELSQTLNIDSTFADAYFIRSSAYSHIQNYKCALSDIKKYIQLKPLDPKGFINVSQLRRFTNVQNSSFDASHEYILPDPSRESLLLSLNDIDHSILLDSSIEEAYYLKAEFLSELCDNKFIANNDSTDNEIINLYTKVLQLDSLNYSAYFNRAQTKLFIGDTIGACVDFTKRMSKDNNCKQALEALCKISKNENLNKRFCSGLH